MTSEKALIELTNKKTMAQNKKNEIQARKILHEKTKQKTNSIKTQKYLANEAGLFNKPTIKKQKQQLVGVIETPIMSESEATSIYQHCKSDGSLNLKNVKLVTFFLEIKMQLNNN